MEKFREEAVEQAIDDIMFNMQMIDENDLAYFLVSKDKKLAKRLLTALEVALLGEK